MNPSAIYSKTGKGVQEASGKTSQLSRGDRAILSAIDGKVNLKDLSAKFDRAADDRFFSLIRKMDQDGFIREVSPGTVQRGAANAPRPAAAKPSQPSQPPQGGREELDFTQIFSAPPKMEKPPGAAPKGDPMAAARHEAEIRQRAEREAKTKADALAKAAIDSTQQFRVTAEAQAKAARETAMQAAAEGKTRAEIEARDRAEAAAKAKAAADAKAKAEAQVREARERVEREAREEEDRREQEENQRQIRLAREAEDKKRRDADARKKKEEEAKRWEQEEARRKSDDAYRQRAEQEDKVSAEREVVESVERAEAEKKAAEAADGGDIPISRDDMGMDDVGDDQRNLSVEARKALRDRSREVARARSRGDQSSGKAAAAYKRKQPMKWGKPVAVVVFLVMLGAVVVLNFTPLSTTEYERLASDAVGAPVKIGSARMWVLAGVQLRFENVSIGESVKISAVRAVPEIDTLLGEDKVFSRLEMDGVVLQQDALAQVLLGGMKGKRLRVARVIAKEAKLQGPLDLPVVDIDATVAHDGRLVSVKLSGERVNGLITPKGADIGFELTMGDYTLPFLNKFSLADFAMKGTANREGMVVSELNGRAYDGTLVGNARIQWGALQSTSAQSSGRTQFTELEGKVALANGTLALRDMELSAGLLKAKGTLDIEPNGGLSGRIDADLRTLRGTMYIGGKLADPQLRR